MTSVAGLKYLYVCAALNVLCQIVALATEVPQLILNLISI